MSLFSIKKQRKKDVMNSGKRFEQNFKNSIPKDIFLYRFKDGSRAWGGNEKVRFQATNICDYLMFDGSYLYLLEMKSTKAKSLPLANIKEHQINDLVKANKYANVVCGFLIEFSKVNEVYFLEIDKFQEFMKTTERKSIPIDYCSDKGIKIEVTKLKTNSRYNVEKMIDDIVKEVI